MRSEKQQTHYGSYDKLECLSCLLSLAAYNLEETLTKNFQFLVVLKEPRNQTHLWFKLSLLTKLGL